MAALIFSENDCCVPMPLGISESNHTSPKLHYCIPHTSPVDSVITAVVLARVAVH